MRIIDTHSHIYQEDFDNDIDEVISRAKAIGVEKILLPNVDLPSIEQLHSLSKKYSGYCLPMMGLHPTSVGINWAEDLAIIKSWFAKQKYIAIGEIGIDLYWDKTYKQEQILAFEEQLRWSMEYNLPVVIHSRDAINECVDCVRNVGADKLRGVFHSFGGSEDELQKILGLGNFTIGINGVVTFKNSTLHEVLQQTNLTKIIVETDAPYLSPVPYRGKRNEPSYTAYVVKRLAEIYNTSVEEVSETTSRNAEELFGI